MSLQTHLSVGEDGVLTATGRGITFGGGDFSGVVVLDEPDETPPFTGRKHFRHHITNLLDCARFTMKKFDVLLENFGKVIHDNHRTVGGGQSTFFTLDLRRRLHCFVLEDNTTPEELTQNDEVWIEVEVVRQEDGILVGTTKTREDLVRNYGDPHLRTELSQLLTETARQLETVSTENQLQTN